MAIVNSELLRLAQQRFNKVAVVLPGMDPAAGGAPPADPAAMGAPPADPAAMGAPAPMPAIDPTAMAAAAAPPMPPAGAPAAAPQQKLKPEQMMQMIDYRLYNMQQQLTAIMNALGVKLPPEAIVLPPGSTAAPAPETALPGGPGAPAAPAAAPASGGDAAAAQLPQDVYAGPDPAQDGGAVAPIGPAKAAWWQQPEPAKAASYIGDPVPATEEVLADLQVSANATSFLLRSLAKNAR
jgi:UV excision repair protein RAD23